MRERLAAAIVGVAVVAVAVFGLTQAYAAAHLVREDERREVGRAAGLVAVTLEERLAAGSSVTPALLRELGAAAGGGTTVTYRAAPGSRSGSGPGSAGSAPRPTDEGRISATRRLPDGSRVTVTRSAATVRDAVADALWWPAVVGLGLIVLTVPVGLLLADRMAQPFRRLAATARRLRAGRRGAAEEGPGPAEARAIGAAMRGGALELADLRRRHRALATHSAHDLRTPVTSLRLELEDLALWPETAPAVARQLEQSLAQLDRLAGAIDEVLALTRRRDEGTAIDLDLAALVESVVRRLRADGAAVEHRSDGPLPTRLDAPAVEELLELLVDEAESEGSEPITMTDGDRGNHLQVTVSPARAGTRDEARWTAAVELAVALGGQLNRAGADGDRLVLRLPKRQLGGADTNGDAAFPQ